MTTFLSLLFAGEIAAPVAFAALFCLTLMAVMALALAVYVCHFKKGYLKITREIYVKPRLQNAPLTVSTTIHRVQRPSKLKLMDNVSIHNSALPSTSTMRTYCSKGSEAPPSFYQPTEPAVPEMPLRCEPQAPVLLQYLALSPDVPGSDLFLFYGGLNSSDSEFV